MATRCCWPPDKRAGHLQRRLGNAEPLQSRKSACALFDGKDIENVEKGRAVVETTEKNVGQHVEPRHQVELLEDHGAVAVPVAKLATGQARNRLALEPDLAAA
jgi:spore coat polysaccharide biosynthesis predicted glycosyltransferase SpsG